MDVLKGVRVVDVTAYMFGPAAGAVLAQWGADVIKIEPARTPEAGRLLGQTGQASEAVRATSYWHYNRGKRGIGLDLASETGREILYQLVRDADVFLTSYLTDTRKKLRIDVDDIRAQNERIIYARASGRGPIGPQAERGGYDLASWWGRGSLADTAAKAAGVDFPPGMTGHGDGMSGLTLAGGICAALFQRANTGKAAVVDGSLMGTAIWFNGPAINAAYHGGTWQEYTPRSERNPLVTNYRTKDGRWIQLCMLASPDADCADLLKHLGRAELASDERFATVAGRETHKAKVVEAFDELFGSYTLAELREMLATTSGVWEAIQTASEIHSDPQTLANGYVRTARHADGREMDLPAPALLFDGDAGEPRPGPDWGEHTDEVLSELGMSENEITALREQKIVK